MSPGGHKIEREVGMYAPSGGAALMLGTAGMAAASGGEDCSDEPDDDLSNAPESGFPIINLGGEGEVPNVINVQGSWISPDDPVSRDIQPKPTFRDLINEGHIFLFLKEPYDFANLPFGDSSVRQVITNNVRIDGSSFLGPFPQTSEIKRVLTRGGTWLHDGKLQYVKP